jgi:hypothetical protein
MRIIFTFSALIFVGCMSRHVRSIPLCNGQFQVQTYNVNPAGVDEDYLTDSSGMSVCIGKYDNEHEKFNFVCIGDSIRISRLVAMKNGPNMEIVEAKTFSIVALRKATTASPLFEFK